MIKPEQNKFQLALVFAVLLTGSGISAFASKASSSEASSSKVDSANDTAPKYDNIPLTEKIQLSDALESDGEHEEAALLLYQIIEEIERKQGRYHPDISPLLLKLSTSLLALERAKEAKAILRKGQHVTHRTYGVLSLDQIPFLDKLTTSLLAMNLPLDANQQQEFGLYLSEHHFEENSTKLVPALTKLSRWYLETNQFKASEKTLERIITIITSSSDDLSLDLIEPLYMLSKTKRLKAKSSCCGEKALMQTIRIVENNPDARNMHRIKAYLELADVQIIQNKTEQADQYYSKAWNLASKNGKAADIFTRPQQLASVIRLENSKVNRYKLARENLSTFTPRRYVPLTALNAKTFKDDGFTEATMDIPPQEVWVSGHEQSYNVLINLANPGQYEGEKSIKLIGHPFQFILRQLLQILPSRLDDPSDLAGIEISLSFTVKENGRVKDVEILDSNAPGQLNKAVMRATKKSKFRPHITEGNRVSSDQVKLTQTFK